MSLLTGRITNVITTEFSSTTQEINSEHDVVTYDANVEPSVTDGVTCNNSGEAKVHDGVSRGKCGEASDTCREKFDIGREELGIGDYKRTGAI